MSESSMSGSFSGHFIPAVFFLGFVSFYLGLSFCRMRTLAKTGGGAPSFTQRFVPESNLQLLRSISWIVIICTSVGIVFEGVGSKWYNYQHTENPSFFANATHQTLYLLFFMPGLAGLFESYGRLPPDSMRGGLVIALAGETILWHEHALMKSNHVDSRLHSLLALISISTSGLFALSIYLPNNIILFVASFCGMILQGTWLVTAAINTMQPISAHLVGVYFVLQVLGLVFIVMMASVYLNGLERRQQHLQAAQVTSDEERFGMGENAPPSNNKVKYEKLQIQDDEDEKENDAGQHNKELDFV